MSQAAPLHVALVWHMHQPDYTDPSSGESLMPWTWLHAVKDYGEMLRTLQSVPEVRATFNLVPTLIEQLQAYAGGIDHDRWLRLLKKDPAHFSGEDRQSALNWFFSVHRQRHIQPWPRYLELAERAHGGSDAFDERDLRDLQVWFLLSWTGHCLRQRSSHIQQLFSQQRFFSEEDKLALIELCQNEALSVLDLYRQMEADGQIEISLTPYAHPILPLLIDTDIARQASTGEPLPEPAFCAPEDARLHVQTSIRMAAEHLGARARGFWPAEGSVSEAAAKMLKAEGALWAASDEGVLAKSLSQGLEDRGLLYRPWTFKGLPLVFRDRGLSDRIGFVYADWDPQQAAEDLISRLNSVAERHPGGLITLILDGENCWERYRENGWPFLQAFYRQLVEARQLDPVTVSEGLQKVKPQPLSQLKPGSWINADFGIWIGHPEENQGWDLLRQAQQDLQPLWQKAASKTPALQDSRQAFLRAEGSDWFWWYGDDHSTDQAATFDLLFRRHLQAAYRAAGQTPPEKLNQPIKRTQIDVGHPPKAAIRPRLDVAVESFLDWRGAGTVPLDRSGAMHGGATGWRRLYWGSDGQQLFLKFEPELSSALEHPERLCVYLSAHHAWKLTPPQDGHPAQMVNAQQTAAIDWFCDTSLRIALPLAPLAADETAEIALNLCRIHEERETARWPAEGPVMIRLSELIPATSWLP